MKELHKENKKNGMEEEEEGVRERKKRIENGTCRSCWSKIHSVICCKGLTNGISWFEIINVLMIIFTFIDLGLKYQYDSIVWK